VANPLQFDESTIKGALTKSKKIYEQSTARRLTMAMQEVLTGSNGVYSGTAAGKGVSLDCAGKTGTTNGNRDAWFCGYTPCYTTSIWVGKDTNEKTSVQGGSVASIWQGFNQAVINKKKLSPSDYTFNLVIMDDSEPEEVFSLEPTETTFDFSSIDPFASLSPTNEWSETAQVFTIEPYTQTPTTDPWITNSPDPQQPTNNGNGGGPNSNEGEGPSSIPGFDPNNATEPDDDKEKKKFEKLSQEEQMDQRRGPVFTSSLLPHRCRTQLATASTNWGTCGNPPDRASAPTSAAPITAAATKRSAVLCS
jgi:membrane peptidoglycan carboxypeptidase